MKKSGQEDRNPDATIFALASAPGRAGVAMLRISGTSSGAVLQLLTGCPLPPPRQAVLRKLYRPADGMLLDKAMLLWFPAPRSFTGEDVAELHLHGGRAVLQSVSAVLAAQPGLRLAEPGEFTRRGFENGKFDLTEAEAIADLVHAETEAQLQQALRQMDGELARLYEGWSESLKTGLAHLEACIDFADEDLPLDLPVRQASGLAALAADIEAHLADHRRGERLREGYRIAIIGPPNAGKSSLLNLLARRDAAIVSHIAGTTRDVVEVQLDLGGYPVIIADTAGLRESQDEIEREGILRAQARAREADLRLLVFDGAHWPQPDAMTLAFRDERAFCIVNKADLFLGDTGDSSCAMSLSETGEVWPVSLLTGYGVEPLLVQLTARVAEALHDRGQPVLTRLRHRIALQEALNEIQAAVQARREIALTAEHLRLAMRALGRITGRVDVEDVLDVIFRDFCIGK